MNRRRLLTSFFAAPFAAAAFVTTSQAASVGTSSGHARADMVHSYEPLPPRGGVVRGHIPYLLGETSPLGLAVPNGWLTYHSVPSARTEVHVKYVEIVEDIESAVVHALESARRRGRIV